VKYMTYAKPQNHPLIPKIGHNICANPREFKVVFVGLLPLTACPQGISGD
jgi:hypothetical protein